MKLSKVVYQGDLRATSEHLASGEKIITDAPVDNQGKGAAFSPTDLTATSLAACIITTIGIAANNRYIAIESMEADVEKIMASAPRRIAGVRVEVRVKIDPDTEENRETLKDIGINCPVAKSLHSDVEQDISFSFS